MKNIDEFFSKTIGNLDNRNMAIYALYVLWIALQLCNWSNLTTETKAVLHRKSLINKAINNKQCSILLD